MLHIPHLCHHALDRNSFDYLLSLNFDTNLIFLHQFMTSGKEGIWSLNFLTLQRYITQAVCLFVSLFIYSITRKLMHGLLWIFWGASELLQGRTFSNDRVNIFDISRSNFIFWQNHLCKPTWALMQAWVKSIRPFSYCPPPPPHTHTHTRFSPPSSLVVSLFCEIMTKYYCTDLLTSNFTVSEFCCSPHLI